MTKTKRTEIIKQYKELARTYIRTSNQVLWEQTAKNLYEFCNQAEYNRLPKYAKK